MEENKLCVDCKWYGKIELVRDGICTRPLATSLVDGKPIMSNLYCSSERRHAGYFSPYCGKQGRFWESKDYVKN